MWPQLAARVSPWALRALGAGRLGGSLGLKAQMIAPPQAPDLPTVPFEQSNLARTFSDMNGWFQQKAAEREQGGVDEAGFASAFPPQQPGAVPPLPPAIDVPSLPVPPASMAGMVPMPRSRPKEADASQALAQAEPQGPFGLPSWDPLYNMGSLMGFEQPVSGPELIKKFMSQLHAAGPGVDYDRHGVNGF